MITEVGEILLRRGLINRDQLLQSRAAANGTSIVDSIVKQGFAKEDEVLRIVADEYGLDFIDLREAEVDLKLLQTFPLKLIYRHALFPVKLENGQLFVATSNPLDLYPLDEAAAATGLAVVPLVAEKVELAKLVKKHLGCLLRDRMTKQKSSFWRKSRPMEANWANKLKRRRSLGS